MTERFEISRRKALAGLGTIGAASAGAGLGTSALFSDTESFEDNAITAGELDLKVGWQQVYYGPTAGEAVRPRDEPGEFINAHPDHDGDGQQSIKLEDDTIYNWNDGGSDGSETDVTDKLNCSRLEPVDPKEDYSSDNRPEQSNLVELSDVKPGDGGQITFNLCLCDNPGYIWLTLSDISEDGGTNPEPEVKAEGNSDNDADLAENLTVYVSLDENCNSQFNDEDTVVWQGTFAEARNLVDEGSNGLLLSEECFEAGCHCVNVGYEVPIDVENEIMGDELCFDLGFYTEQCRHNPDPSFPKNNTAE